jgi:hypothetical protein
MVFKMESNVMLYVVGGIKVVLSLRDMLGIICSSSDVLPSRSLSKS